MSLLSLSGESVRLSAIRPLPSSSTPISTTCLVSVSLIAVNWSDKRRDALCNTTAMFCPITSSADRPRISLAARLNVRIESIESEAIIPLPIDVKILSISSLTRVISCKIVSAWVYMRALAMATAAVFANAIKSVFSRSVKRPACKRLST